MATVGVPKLEITGSSSKINLKTKKTYLERLTLTSNSKNGLPFVSCINQRKLKHDVFLERKRTWGTVDS